MMCPGGKYMLGFTYERLEDVGKTMVEVEEGGGGDLEGRYHRLPKPFPLPHHHAHFPFPQGLRPYTPHFPPPQLPRNTLTAITIMNVAEGFSVTMIHQITEKIQSNPRRLLLLQYLNPENTSNLSCLLLKKKKKNKRTKNTLLRSEIEPTCQSADDMHERPRAKMLYHSHWM